MSTPLLPSGLCLPSGGPSAPHLVSSKVWYLFSNPALEPAPPRSLVSVMDETRQERIGRSLYL